jgi:DNA replication protein DnaC
MRLSGMVTAWEAIQADADARQMSFEEKLALMVDRQYTQRQNEALTRRLRYAKLKGNAAVENIDYRAARGLDKGAVRALTQDSAWVGRHENIFITGPTGVGKSYIACALAQKACRDGHLVLYTRAPALFRDLSLGRADGSLRHVLARLARVDVLIVDDWAMAEERYQSSSTILTSQVPVSQWHQQIGDPTVAADGILDRLVHNAHRFELKGESLRRANTKKEDKAER